MVATGYALMSTHAALVPDHIDRGRQLADAEVHARAKRAGLWAEWLGRKAVNEE